MERQILYVESKKMNSNIENQLVVAKVGERGGIGNEGRWYKGTNF